MHLYQVRLTKHLLVVCCSWLLRLLDELVMHLLSPSRTDAGRVLAGSALDSLLAFPVANGSTSWLSLLDSSFSSSLMQQAQSLLLEAGRQRKVLSNMGRRALLQRNEPPAGGVKGSGCGSWCYGR